MNSNKICELQNKKELLKIQYAARKSFNNAEYSNYYAWIMCLVAMICNVLPENMPIYICYGLPFVADVISAYFSFDSNRKVQWASRLRRFFDSNVLEINKHLLEDAEIRAVKEYTENISMKNRKEEEIQINNNGNDIPPGVKDWYIFQKSIEGLEAKFECQKQNIWWNKKMMSRRVIINIIIGIIFIIITVSLFSYNGILKTVLCSGGILVKICDRAYQNYKYIRVSNEIDGSVKTIENNLSVHGIERLQMFIDERRAINVLEIGAIHKRMARKWTSLYNKIV